MLFSRVPIHGDFITDVLRMVEAQKEASTPQRNAVIHEMIEQCCPPYIGGLMPMNQLLMLLRILIESGQISTVDNLAKRVLAQYIDSPVIVAATV